MAMTFITMCTLAGVKQHNFHHQWSANAHSMLTVTYSQGPGQICTWWLPRYNANTTLQQKCSTELKQVLECGAGICWQGEQKCRC